MKRILTGLQPSGELTLGSLIGSISQMVKYQDEYESFMFVPDMHAITVKQDPKLLKERIIKNVALYIACGLDPKKNTIYIQSENLYHTNLSWVLECHTYIGEASRMTQFKDKSKKQENVTVGLFTYPILMASDILLYDADYVPVGIDQKQHVELARNIAESHRLAIGIGDRGGQQDETGVIIESHGHALDAFVQTRLAIAIAIQENRVAN